MTMTRLLRIGRHRVRALFAQAAVDDELARELAFHFERLVEEQVAAGLRPEAARQAARRSLGSPAAIEDACRDHRRVGWLQDLGQDAACAVRMLRRSRAFACVAIGSLGISIGAAAAVAGVALTVYVRDIPMPAGDRIVVALNAADTEFRTWIGIPALEAAGGSLPDERDLSLVADQPPVARIAGAAATPGLFTALQVVPQLGRLFSAEDPPQVIVVSDALWRSVFEADPQVVGRTVRLSGIDASVIGVMPPGFGISAARVQYWVPMAFRAPGRPSGPFYTLVGRLRPGARDADIRAALGDNTRVTPLRQAWFGWMTRSLATLAAAVSLGWLIACMNVSGLLRARAAARASEFQLRLALGARAGRIVRQIMAEALVLALAGGALAALVAWSALAVFATMRPPLGLSRAIHMPMDGGLAAGIAFLALASAALCSATAT
jgi:putative ABC transport system permease protein